MPGRLIARAAVRAVDAVGLRVRVAPVVGPLRRAELGVAQLVAR